MCLSVCQSVCLSVCLSVYISYPKKLQQRLSNKIANDIAADLIANSQSERIAARLRSVQGQGAGGWLEVIPTSDKYAIRSNEFSLASHLRLGLALPFTNFINECDCGKELDKNGYHLLTCKYGSGPVWSHNCIVDGWTECLSDLHIPYQVEPRHYTNTDNRPDIAIFDIETGQTLDLDISLAHPWSVDNVKRASRIDGFAASAREDKKKAKSSEHQLPRGSESKCVPLVLEHFGCWGEELNVVQFKSHWRKRLSVILQKCNAKMLLRKLSRLSCDNIVADDLFDFDIQYQVH